MSPSAAGGLSLVWACVCMNVCACVCVQSPSKACCSALLCWPGHVATLKLLSESPVKLLRSSTTLAVGSGNPFASCSLHTPSLLHFPFPISHVLPLMRTLTLRLSVFAPISLSVCICVSVFSCSLSPTRRFPLSVCFSFWQRYLHNLCSETSLRTFCLFWHWSGCTCFLVYTCSNCWKCTLATDTEPRVAMMAI